MNDILYLIFAFIAGLVLGAIFFGGLWLTIKKTFVSKIPALWIFVSFLFRIGITLIGFYYISLGNWQRLLISLLGFVAARIIILRITKTNEDKQIQLRVEANHDA